MHSKTGNFLYFWFFGVEPGFNGNGDAIEIKNEIFHLSEKQNLPIYLETSVEKIKGLINGTVLKYTIPGP